MIFFLQSSALNMDVNNKLYDDVFSFVPSKNSRLGLVLMVGKPNTQSYHINITCASRCSMLCEVGSCSYGNPRVNFIGTSFCSYCTLPLQ